ncbi:MULTISPECIES: MarR family winged helix-turn-helix transcriptional regulator [unclassified Flammeovirga]|uniref:MarR family winged helix-turn-helix transcriptional regulator n=1 Tax=unclassified Flammeovirga TaxID=2637820 RepID=UPI0005C495A5|nr:MULTISPECIES: MarR family transcriptional regulator [unclassified Flammeovirga]KXX71950.1 hypothetical protein AVL50_03965 [Flammeovirga sp. SJP92]
MHSKKYYKAIHQIIVTGHWITDQVGKDLKEYGITEPQFNVLRILKGQKGDPITVQEIQERMVQRSSNVTRIVDKLLDKQLVLRKECPTNRRKMDITITEKGLEELQKLDTKVGQFHEQFQGNLSEEELETLATLIKKLKGE